MQKAWIDMRTLIGCYTTRGYCLSLKSFEQSLLAATAMTLWQGTFVLIKLGSSLAGNIISQVSKRMLRPKSKAAKFVWP